VVDSAFSGSSMRLVTAGEGSGYVAEEFPRGFMTADYTSTEKRWFPQVEL